MLAKAFFTGLILACGLSGSAQAARLDVGSEAQWTFSGTERAFPVDDPLSDVFLQFGGPFSGVARAANFGTNSPRVEDTRRITVTNPLATDIQVSLAFQYSLAIFLADGFFFMGEPGDYDVSSQAAVFITVGDGDETTLGNLLFEERVSCTSFPCVRDPFDDNGGFAEYVGFGLGPNESVDIALRSFARTDVVPVGAGNELAAVPLPAAAPLAIGSLAFLAGLRRRSRRSA
ncbi:hypothetical protein DKT77_03665 [Meridianimarinicoccus roseus]|jgi:hypothetical protein|uniref:PEP-CTERM sorting domain-containing protein n=1 Tax=Meridianimarinicoccus roseus TaxID=2072018 RepID=A0A2V2LLN7_9RHOB|nr:hypothetical protein [Meridianimarinicoccus roseus]PWR03987.1 hypothetical protein DKT77_03665 [Meridianimarinicoccus roseus]